MAEEAVQGVAGVVAYEGQPAAAGPPSAGEQMLNVKPEMMVLSWIAFGLVAVALAKFLWKPVLQGLEKREKGIQDALEAAERARADVANTQKRIRSLKEDADKDIRERVDASIRQAAEIRESAKRDAAAESARHLREAEAQIAAERQSAMAEVQAEALRTFGATLERVLSQQLTDEQKRAYQAAMVREMHL